jgi:hypothetical protein
VICNPQLSPSGDGKWFVLLNAIRILIRVSRYVFSQILNLANTYFCIIFLGCVAPSRSSSLEAHCFAISAALDRDEFGPLKENIKRSGVFSHHHKALMDSMFSARMRSRLIPPVRTVHFTV